MIKQALLIGLLVLTACRPRPNAAQLQALFDEAWKFQLAENPLFATSAGVNDFNDRLPSVSLPDQQRRAEFYRSALHRLDKLDISSLSDENRLNAAIFRSQLEDALSEFEHQSFLIPITVDSGFHIEFARLPQQVPLHTVHDYENYIRRLQAFSAYAQQNIQLMKRGIEAGITLPRVVLEGYEATVRSQVVNNPEQSGFAVPFRNFPDTMPSSERDRLRAAGEAAIRESVLPGYRTFLDFLLQEYIPKSRLTIAVSDLPKGLDYYAYLVRHFTTLPLTAEEVHQTGLAEVRRIRAEMDDVIQKTGFSGSFADFLKFLRTDARFYAKSPEELLKEAAFIAKRMDGKLPSLFKTLPRLPYGIQPVPDDLAPKFTGGRYVDAPIGGTQPGYYWVNTYALHNRPLYVLEALTLHEAVPGHHLQIALQQELKGLPDFRRFAGAVAFVEGWALYSEWLGVEAGFYTDPYSQFGRLTYEMWRACRLVVDTGIHAMSWTRGKAMDFLASNTALSLHEVKTETDRYIASPGQALAYKIGELKIRQLRKEAEQALGESFDVREFHDVVLRGGAIPLGALERQVRSYVERARKASS
jgi:uncharacterized protein (DUF885 family)